MKTGTKFFIGLVVALLTIGLVTFINRAPDGNGALVEAVEHSEKPVETVVIEPTSLEESIERTGVLEPKRDVVLTAEVGGKVRHVHRDLGDTCKSGQTLIQLDAETYRIALLDAQASLRQSEASLEESERTLDRANKLKERKLASEQDLDRTGTAVESARAMKERAQAAVQMARRNLREATITCPFDGVVASRMVDVGQLVGPQTPVVRFVDNRELKLTLTVSVAELSRMQVGQKVSLHDPTLPDATYEGEVARLGVAADPTTRTFPVEVSVHGDADGPRPGQVVRSVIQIATHEGTIALPTDAVTLGVDGPSVFVVVENTVHKKMVELGPRVTGRVIIESGVAVGEEVVVVGVHGLQSGDKVKVVGKRVEPANLTATEAADTKSETTSADSKAEPPATAQSKP
ncbi:efflux RND transporter periplasmic adaptor subunit [Myxococcota bacterium]